MTVEGGGHEFFSAHGKKSPSEFVDGHAVELGMALEGFWN
jgi:hypothetical protein